MGVPQITWFRMDNHSFQRRIWGYPQFRKPLDEKMVIQPKSRDFKTDYGEGTEAFLWRYTPWLAWVMGPCGGCDHWTTNHGCRPWFQGLVKWSASVIQARWCMHFFWLFGGLEILNRTYLNQIMSKREEEKLFVNSRLQPINEQKWDVLVDYPAQTSHGEKYSRVATINPSNAIGTWEGCFFEAEW